MPPINSAGYWWELSMRQIGTSRTLVFDAPRRARGFFEALVADNLDLGRPDEVQLTFGRKIRSDTQSEFSTKVVTRGVDVIVNRLRSRPASFRPGEKEAHLQRGDEPLELRPEFRLADLERRRCRRRMR
jgi:hypothetical protein